MSRLTRLPSDQRGFTLVELLIAVSLMVLVSVVIGGILINTLTAEKTVRTTTQATSAGQLVASSIEQGVRNATWIDLAATGGEYFLRVRTASGAATVTWNCQAWFISGGKTYMRLSPTVITRPTTANLTGWTLLASGLTQSGTTSLLTKDDRQIHITFEVSAGDAKPVLISTSALSRQTGTESAPCG
jgi:prepilin-type N-terminal cleavage/methylation domain-containing protein